MRGRIKKIISLIFLFTLSFCSVGRAANDVASIGPTNFEILSTDTAITKNIVEANGGVTTAFDVESNYIDVTLDNSSNAQFNTDGTVFFDIQKQTGGDNYTVTPDCPTTSVTLSGTAGFSVVLRMRVYLNPPPCTRAGRSVVYVTNTSIEINNGAATTDSKNVTVHLAAQGADQVIIGNDSSFIGEDWQPFTDNAMDVNWTLSDGLGTKAVYAMFKSLTGELSSLISASIELVAPTTTPPSTTPPTTTPPSTTPPTGGLTPFSSLQFGDLIKGTYSTVYYYAKDGKRYIFPNAKTYFSWYTDFKAVKNVSDSDLLQIPLGNNVTYRPGVKMVKIQLDPKVYAVDGHGTLRWVETEGVARALYGDDWAKKIDDLPEIFFTDYKIGTPIAASADFNPAAATAAALDIATDKGLN